MEVVAEAATEMATEAATEVAVAAESDTIEDEAVEEKPPTEGRLSFTSWSRFSQRGEDSAGSCSGYLYKQSGRASAATWKRRWVVLSPGEQTLRIYRSELDARPVGCLQLDGGVSTRRVPAGGHRSAFEVSPALAPSAGKDLLRRLSGALSSREVSWRLRSCLLHCAHPVLHTSRVVCSSPPLPVHRWGAVEKELASGGWHLQDAG